jgi:hypothetical protein
LLRKPEAIKQKQGKQSKKKHGGFGFIAMLFLLHRLLLALLLFFCFVLPPCFCFFATRAEGDKTKQG